MLCSRKLLDQKLGFFIGDYNGVTWMEEKKVILNDVR
jgi:hypothetical protein